MDPYIMREASLVFIRIWEGKGRNYNLGGGDFHLGLWEEFMQIKVQCCLLFIFSLYSFHF